MSNTGKELDYNKLDPGIWFGSYMKNGEWDIVKVLTTE